MPTALITGAGRGLGAALASAFSAAGYWLILHSNESEVGAWKGLSVRGDLRESRTIDALVLAGTDMGVDILVNNAGIYESGDIGSTSEERIREVMEVNLIAPMLLTTRLLPILKQSRNGMVVNINSMAGKMAAKGESVYAASKHGLRGFSNSMKFEGVKILDVYSGAMQTDMAKDRADFDKLIDPEEASKMIVKLCSFTETMRIPEIDIARSNY